MFSLTSTTLHLSNPHLTDPHYIHKQVAENQKVDEETWGRV